MSYYNSNLIVRQFTVEKNLDKHIKMNPMANNQSHRKREFGITRDLNNSSSK